MATFDLTVIGGGAANNLASAAARDGLDVALVEKRALGGTCLTRGCNPSKTLVHRARLVEDIRDAGDFGIEAALTDIDFSQIIAESTEPFDAQAEHMEEHMQDMENLSLFKGEGAFVDEETIAVNDEEISAEKIVVAAGARPVIPPIDGIDDVDYVTSDGILRLDGLPDHLVVIGGGYVGAEMGYVYGEFGADVTIISRSEQMLPRQDGEVRETLTTCFADRYEVLTGYEATAVAESDADQKTVEAEGSSGDTVEITGDELLVATGRRPNADVLDVQEAGIDTDDDGFIEVDENMESSVDDIWAVGDIAGNHMFWHSAIHEAEYVYRHIVGDREDSIDYPGMAQAIFTSPEVASTGATEEELQDDDTDYSVGTYDYEDTTMGNAMSEETGFVKVLADPETEEMLGCHIIGPQASTLIHEVTTATNAGDGTLADITDAIHVHPAMNEVVKRAFRDV